MYASAITSLGQSEAVSNLSSNSFKSLNCWRVTYLIGLISLSCDQTTPSRVCEPGEQRGCRSDQHCTLDARGTPQCASIPTSPLSSHEACEQSNQCAMGSACVSLFGATRCSPMCAADLSQVEADLQCEAQIEHSRCLARLPDRPEIGFCISPCTLSDEASRDRQCGASNSCALSASIPFSVCQASGEVNQNEVCGANQICESGLSCIQNGMISRCKELWVGSTSLEDQNCSEGEISFLSPWARDPLSGGAYLSCWSDIPVMYDALYARQLRLDLKLSSKDEATQACMMLLKESENIRIAHLDNSLLTLSELQRELSSILERARINTPGVWVTTEELLSETCVRFDHFSGRLEPTDCSVLLPSLCEISTSGF